MPDGSGKVVRQLRDDQHQVVGALGSDGMANSREPLINVVSSNKPKMLKGLNQNGMWEACEYPVSRSAATLSHRRTGGAYSITSGTDTERGKPDVFPLGKASRKDR